MIPLADLEAAVARDLDATDVWAVYADALEDLGESRRADAIRAALAGSPSTPEPSVAREAGWRFGHWRTVRAAPQEVAEVLREPWARFLEELVVSEEPGALPADLPPSPGVLTRLHVEGNATLGLAAFPALRHLHHLIAPRLTLGEALDAPALTRLVVGSADPQALTHLPSLRALELRHPCTLDALRALLTSPAGARLHRLTISGVDPEAAADLLASAPDATLQIDDPDRPAASTARPSPRVVLRHSRERATGEAATFLQVAPPVTLLEQRALFRDTCEALGLGERCGSTLGAWLGVAPSVAGPLATAMAARAEHGVRVLHLRPLVDPEAVWLGAEALEVQPDGTASPVELDVLRIARALGPIERGEDQWSVSNPPEAFDWLVAAVFGVARPVEVRVAVPSPWEPDPWALVRPRTGPVARRILGPSARTWTAEMGRYLHFRASQAGALRDSTPPDLERWTPRLLRRHGLEEPPSDPDHPFWTEWWARTRPERTGEVHPKGILTHKLTAKGRWVLPPEEAHALALALRQPVPFHAVPRHLADDVDAARHALEATVAAAPVEIEVW